jgi:hypothetical protein
VCKCGWSESREVNVIHRSAVQITMNGCQVVFRVSLFTVLVYKVTNLLFTSQPVEASDKVPDVSARCCLSRLVGDSGSASSRIRHGPRVRGIWLLCMTAKTSITHAFHGSLIDSHSSDLESCCAQE